MAISIKDVFFVSHYFPCYQHNLCCVDAASPSFSPVMPINVCPGETANFICTVIDNMTTGNTFWTGTAFGCDQNRILLVNADFEGGTTGVCNNGTVVAQSVGVDDNCYTSNLSVTLSPQLDGTTVECRSVGNYTLTVSGMQQDAL